MKWKHSKWNENFPVYENLPPPPQNGHKAEENCNTAAETQLHTVKQAPGSMKVKNRKDKQ